MTDETYISRIAALEAQVKAADALLDARGIAITALETELTRHTDNDCIRELEEMVTEESERANENGRKLFYQTVRLKEAMQALERITQLEQPQVGDSDDVLHPAPTQAHDIAESALIAIAAVRASVDASNRGAQSAE